MFQFRRFPSYAYFVQRTMIRYCRIGFPHSEIHGYYGYLLLPVAYRSLSRPSSAPDAKAFPLRSFQLDLRRRKLRIARRRPPAFQLATPSHSLRCSAFSSQTHFVGLCSEGTGVQSCAPLALPFVRECLVLLNYAGFTVFS